MNLTRAYRANYKIFKTYLFEKPKNCYIQAQQVFVTGLESKVGKNRQKKTVNRYSILGIFLFSFGAQTANQNSLPQPNTS
jgi:hypothetical protein